MAAAFRFLRHHARRPTLANIKPGMPAPTKGPGTAAAASCAVRSVTCAFAAMKALHRRRNAPFRLATQRGNLKPLAAGTERSPAAAHVRELSASGGFHGLLAEHHPRAW